MLSSNNNKEVREFIRSLMIPEEKRVREDYIHKQELDAKKAADFLQKKPIIIEKAWEIFDEAIDFLFEGQHVDYNQRNALYDLMSEQIYYTHCSVMYAVSHRAKNLCDQLGLDMGRREIDINDTMHLEKIKDYGRRHIIPPSTAKA